MAHRSRVPLPLARTVQHARRRNGQAIHAANSVPTSPASHGCAACASTTSSCPLKGQYPHQPRERTLLQMTPVQARQYPTPPV